MTTNPQPTTETLASCPFCGGPAEKRLTDGPKRGFIGCFTCMIGLPFNAPYGDTEVAAWNSRTPTSAPPLCSVHAALDAKDELELEICNDCIACSLNQRADMLKLLESYIPAGETVDAVDAVEFLRTKLVPASAAPVVDENDLISRAAAKAAMCNMCANRDRYKPAEALEGSMRLFHFQRSDNWNAGQCLAQAIDSLPAATTAPQQPRSNHFPDEALNKGFPDHISRDGTAYYSDGTVLPSAAPVEQSEHVHDYRAVKGQLAPECKCGAVYPYEIDLRIRHLK